MTTRFLTVRLPALLLGLTLAACGGDDDGSSADSNGGGDTTYLPAPKGPNRPATLPPSAVDCEGGEGVVEGRFLAPNGKTPVTGAWIYVESGDCWAGTDRQGRFSARGLPTAETKVRAEKGIFRTEANASSGKVEMRIEPSDARFAYAYGSFDTVQELLEELGFEPTQIEVDDFTRVDFSQYHALFLNCGLSEFQAEDESVLQALRAYVQGGGVLYASDWAEIYVEKAFPGRVTFVSPWPRIGEMGEANATVLDEGLKRALGKSTATIGFDMPAWAVIDSVGADTEVLIRGQLPFDPAYGGTDLGVRPLLVQFREGEGRVTYTSFHNEALATDDALVILEQLIFGL